MAKIRPLGFQQSDLVKLMAKKFGTAWIPMSSFSDIGDAALVEIGSSTPVGMDFGASADEAIDTSWLVPKNMDVTKALYIYVYWSSADTDTDENILWEIDYLSVAAGESIGASFSTVAAAVDANEAADYLQIAPVITIPANACAVGDVLYLNLRRNPDAAGDTLSSLAAAYGIRIDYTCKPSISALPSTQHADIKMSGYRQEDLVRLLDTSVGQLWVPIAEFDDIGDAEISAVIGSGLATGYLFDQTTDEAMSVNLMMPANTDVSKAMSVYAYWSAGVTSGNVSWNLDYIARAVGEDVGESAATDVAAGVDTTAGTANYLSVSPVMAVAANALASTDEILSLSIRRDAGDDTVAADAVLYGIRVDYTTKPAISTSETVTDIKPTGVRQGDMVTLLDGQVGRMWLPSSKFSNFGASAAPAAIGGTTFVGMALQAASADEAFEIPILVPPEMDVKHPAYITIYWSSDDTTGGETLQLDFDYIAVAVGGDVGALGTDEELTEDTHSTTPDTLQTIEVVTLAADTFASTAEILFLRLRRDYSEDTLSSDAEVYGIKIDYTCSPGITS